MFLRKIENNIEYPYSLTNLRKDYPNVSFHTDIENDLMTLEHFNIYKVENTDKPNIDDKNEKVEEIQPAFIDNVWKQQWKIVSLSEGEKSVRNFSKIAQVKAYRRQLLMQSDWTQYKDISEEISTKWQPYRQALRDITQQPGFPWDINWPTQPE